jgi:hypothetical protein
MPLGPLKPRVALAAVEGSGTMRAVDVASGLQVRHSLRSWLALSCLPELPFCSRQSFLVLPNSVDDARGSFPIAEYSRFGEVSW